MGLPHSSHPLPIILYLLVTSSLLGYVITWDDVLKDEADDTRREVEKDVLRHSIAYLKTKLVKCLRESENYRHKRKIQVQVEDILMHQIELEVLENTQKYLIERVVNCRRQGQHINIVDRSDTSGIQQNHPNIIQTFNDKVMMTTTTKTPLIYPALKAPMPTSPPIKPKSKNWGKPRTFSLEGRVVSCDSVEITGDQASLTCRNLLVDGKHRLPNYDICPQGTFNPKWWRHLNEIQSRTFDVLDLRGFCTALGNAASIPMPVLDVKVNWNCEDTKHRLSWLNGKWAGEVADNGYLHDIECLYYSYVT